MYGILSVILPMFFFEGDIIENFREWFTVLFSFSGSETSRSILLTKLFYKMTGFWLLEKHLMLIKLVFISVLLVGVFLSKKKRKEFIFLSVIVYLMIDECYYTLGFFSIPLLVFLREEKYLYKNNLFYFVMLLLLVLPMPIFGRYTRMIYNDTMVLIIIFACILEIWQYCVSRKQSIIK